MAFTYDITTDRGKTRLRLSDTDSTAYCFEDAEIDLFISDGGTVALATVEGLKVLIVDRARRTKSFGLKGLQLDDRHQVEALMTAIKLYGGEMPDISITLPASIPMDEAWDESNP